MVSGPETTRTYKRRAGRWSDTGLRVRRVKGAGTDTDGCKVSKKVRSLSLKDETRFATGLSVERFG